MKRYMVIGVGQFGYSVAKTLVELGCDVLAVDIDENRIQEISDQILGAQREAMKRSLELTDLESQLEFTTSAEALKRKIAAAKDETAKDEHRLALEAVLADRKSR